MFPTIYRKVQGEGTESDYPWTLLSKIPSNTYNWFGMGGHVGCNLEKDEGANKKGHPCPFCGEKVKLPDQFMSWIQPELFPLKDYATFIKHCWDKHPEKYSGAYLLWIQHSQIIPP